MPQLWTTLKYSFDRELTYNLTRPYPFGRSFKLLVFAGFAVLLCLVIVFSIANSAYEPRPVFVSSPNETEAQQYWFNAWPFTFGDDRLHPRCEAFDVPIGHEFMTTNLGLRYKVDRISSDTKNGSSNLLDSSFPYHYHDLTNCEVNEIEIKLRRSAPLGPWYSWDDSYVIANTQCDIPNKSGVSTIFFSTSYGPDFHHPWQAVDDPDRSGSFWWGGRLLESYFYGVQILVAHPLDNGGDDSAPEIGSATLNYYAGDVDDARSRDLFKLKYGLVMTDGSMVHHETDGYADTSITYNNRASKFSPLLTEGFFFAKMMRSMILSDLGDNRTSNLLAHEDGLKYALGPSDDFNRVTTGQLIGLAAFEAFRAIEIGPSMSRPNQTSGSVVMSEAYSLWRNDTGPLGMAQARIFARYVCSVPLRKGTATILLFTLVAIMTIMQTAWLLFKWFAEIAVEARDQNAMICEGCLSRLPLADDGAPSSPLEKGVLVGENEVEMSGLGQRAYQPLVASA